MGKYPVRRTPTLPTTLTTSPFGRTFAFIGGSGLSLLAPVVLVSCCVISSDVAPSSSDRTGANLLEYGGRPTIHMRTGSASQIIDGGLSQGRHNDGIPEGFFRLESESQLDGFGLAGNRRRHHCHAQPYHAQYPGPRAVGHDTPSRRAITRTGVSPREFGRRPNSNYSGSASVPRRPPPVRPRGRNCGRAARTPRAGSPSPARRA